MTENQNLLDRLSRLEIRVDKVEEGLQSIMADMRELKVIIREHINVEAPLLNELHKAVDENAERIKIIVGIGIGVTFAVSVAALTLQLAAFLN